MLSTRTASLGRKPFQRKALLRNLATSLILYESIRTTRSRAKAVQPIIDRLIAKAKAQPTHVAIRYLNRVVTDKNACKKTLEVLVPRYEKRPSGFSSIKPVGRRKGDGAELVEITLVDSQVAAS